MITSDRPTATSEAPRYRMFSGVLRKVEDGFNLIAAASILVLMLLAVIQIFGRTLFNAPIPGYIDITEQAMAVFAFMGIAYCQRVGGHIRMEIVLGKLKGRALWVAECMSVSVVLLAVIGLIYGSWYHFSRSWNIGDSTIDIGLPTWPSKLVVPIALTLLGLRLAMQVYGYARLIANPAATQIAVPVIMDVEELAQHEIEEAFGEGDEDDDKEAAR